MVCLWVNERKLVSYAKVINEAKHEMMTISPNKIDDANDYRLVHTIGETENAEDVEDLDF